MNASSAGVPNATSADPQRMNPDIRRLELAIAHGDAFEVETLLDSAPELVSVHFPENVGLTPLMWACRNRHATIVELLLQRGADVRTVNPTDSHGEGGNIALWFTAQGLWPGNVPVARLLLNHGADLDTIGEFGTTPFFMAVAWFHLELVQFFLERGADPTIANHGGQTPLQFVRDGYAALQPHEPKTENARRFIQRAPRMIAFLEKVV